jgi:5S rRNA maturation endonuclease (ribonuclease M5)
VKEKKSSETVAPPAAVTVFEGFIDLLSALTFYRVATPQTPVIVLNGVSLKQKAVSVINQMSAGKVYLYLDRDDAGQRLGQYFQKHLPSQTSLVDKSGLYQDYKDFNQFLVASLPANLSR